MTNGGSKHIRFIRSTVLYWFVAGVAVSYASLRTCGMTPDAAAQCDLRTIRVVSELAVGGYLLFLFRYARSMLKVE
jgi:hypothetical protein